MSARRFSDLNWYLYVVHPDVEKETYHLVQKKVVEEDKFLNVRLLINSLIVSFEAQLIPEKELALDEGMVGYRGRLSWNHYCPMKPTKH